MPRTNDSADARAPAGLTTIFHCSDLHFGHPAVPVQYEAIESLIAERRPDVVAISGDFTQRSRSGEFQRARVFIQHAKRYSEIMIQFRCPPHLMFPLPKGTTLQVKIQSCARQPSMHSET